LVEAACVENLLKLSVKRCDFQLQPHEVVYVRAQHVRDVGQNLEAWQRVPSLQPAQVRCRDTRLGGEIIQRLPLHPTHAPDRRPNPLPLDHWPLNHDAITFLVAIRQTVSRSSSGRLSLLSM